MNVTYKQLLESSYIQVNTKVEEIKRFFDMTRTYSIKTNGHLKIITSLVNELTDSDDVLHLVSTELTGYSFNTKYTHTTNTNKVTAKNQNEPVTGNPTTHMINVNVHDHKSAVNQDEQARSVNNHDRNHTTSTNEQTRLHQNPEMKQIVPKSHEDNILTKLIESFKNENQKLWERIEKGQSDADFIKGILEKLLDGYTKQKSNELNLFPTKPERDSLQQMSQMPPMNPQSVKNGMPPQQSSQSCYVPHNSNGRQAKVHNEAESERFNDAESLNSLKDDLIGNNRFGQDTKVKKGGNESGIQNLFKQVFQLKSELEKITREKDAQINNLTLMLEETRNNSMRLLQEVEALTREKMSFENSAKDLIGQTKNMADRSLQTANSKCNDLEREVLNLQAQLEQLSNENEDFRRKARDNQKSKDNNDEFYKIKFKKLEEEHDDLKNKCRDFENKNGELINLLESTKEKRSKTKTASELTAIDYNDDMLKCLYSQADYIESGMGSIFSNSIFRT